MYPSSRLPLGLDGPPGQLRPVGSGSRRAGAAAVSLALHAGVIVAMMWLPGGGTAARTPTLYEQEIEPHKDKIVWYRLKTLPTVTPGEEPKTIRHPAAAMPNRDTIVSHMPDAPPALQLAWTDAPKPQPREFKAPDMISVRKQPKLAENAPQLAPEAAGEMKAAQLSAPKLAPKPFVAPGRESPQAKPARAVSLSDAPTLASVTPAAGFDPSLAALAAASGVKTPKPFTAPQASKPGARVGTGAVAVLSDAPGIPAGGSSDVNALVLNTLPAALPAGVPPPSNSNVSAGPAAGRDAGGSGAGLRLPGITVQPGARSPLPEAPAQNAPLVPPPYIATSVAPMKQTFSAPLAPSSRSIPAAIENHFHNRVVYLVILPMKRAPGYSADWVMWFAERQPDGGAGMLVQVRPPLPIRKIYRPKAGVEMPRTVQLMATIDRNGKPEDIRPLTAPGGAAAAAAIEDFRTWEFLPALRNRNPVDVDVIVELTFSSTDSSGVIHPPGSGTGN